MSYRGLVTSKISPELFVFMKTKTYVVTNAVNDAAKTAAKTDIKYYIDVIGQ